MKWQRARILGIIGLVLFTTSACQKAGNDITGNGTRRAVALAELNDGSMVEVNCLVQAAKKNVDPRSMCSTISPSDTQPVTSAMQALQMRGTHSKTKYYYCTGSCGWNDYYANFNTMYYSYGNNIPAQSWNQQFGVPQNYYYQYMYNYNYGTGNNGGYNYNYNYNYNYGYGVPQQTYYGNNYPSSCNSNVWYGGDYTRYGGCYNNVFFM